MELIINNTTIKIIKDDITLQKVDAIVNAANSSLMGGGGVDGAIHRAGGNKILEECKEIIKKIKSLPTGEAVITSAGNMMAKYVIHTVGPVWYGGDKNEPKLLKNAYFNSLALGTKYNLKSIAFPSISTGVYGYPVRQAGEIAIKTTIDFLKNEKHSYNEVRFIVFSSNDYTVYESILKGVKI
jgi:O-acetyl-ADP-ribose deacetylase (regulator of RNase III)